MAKFKDLPLETREAIWGFCLPTEPAIFFPNSGVFALFWNDPCLLEEQSDVSPCLYGPETREVDVEFPITMHLCHESRRHTLEHLPLVVRGVGHKIFYIGRRHYRPDFDILYLPEYKDLNRLRRLIQEERRVLEKMGQKYQPLYWQIKHIALDMSAIWDLDHFSRYLSLYPYDAFVTMPGLRQVSMVSNDNEIDTAMNTEGRDTHGVSGRVVLGLAPHPDLESYLHGYRFPDGEPRPRMREVLEAMEAKFIENGFEDCIDGLAPVEESGKLLIKFVASKLVKLAQGRFV